MIDSIGGAVKVNNFLTALDLKLISLENLKEMERRAGTGIEAVAAESQRRSAEEAYNQEMEDITKQEIQESCQNLEEAGGIEDLGVWLPPDSSPFVRKQFNILHDDGDWTDIEDEPTSNHNEDDSFVPAPQNGDSNTPSKTQFMHVPPPVSKIHNNPPKIEYSLQLSFLVEHEVVCLVPLIPPGINEGLIV